MGFVGIDDAPVKLAGGGEDVGALPFDIHANAFMSGGRSAMPLNRLPDTFCHSTEAARPKSAFSYSQALSARWYAEAHFVAHDWPSCVFSTVPGTRVLPFDSVARAVILSELGCFDNENAPDLVRARNYQWAREDAAELRRHKRMLETFLKKQAAHDDLLARRPRFYMPRRYYMEREGGGTLRKILEIELIHIKRSVTELNLVHRPDNALYYYDSQVELYPCRESHPLSCSPPL
jgi:hypothetical protein